jgi:hypothetical protein
MVLLQQRCRSSRRTCTMTQQSSAVLCFATSAPVNGAILTQSVFCSRALGELGWFRGCDEDGRRRWRERCSANYVMHTARTGRAGNPRAAVTTSRQCKYEEMKNMESTTRSREKITDHQSTKASSRETNWVENTIPQHQTQSGPDTWRAARHKAAELSPIAAMAAGSVAGAGRLMWGDSSQGRGGAMEPVDPPSGPATSRWAEIVW